MGIFEEDKSDTIDAYRIVDFLRFERFNTSLLKEEKYVALQRYFPQLLTAAA